jgi:hypothetical protein
MLTPIKYSKIPIVYQVEASVVFLQEFEDELFTSTFLVR